MNVCLIYGSASDTPWVDEVILRIVENELLAKNWIRAYEIAGGWKNLHYEIWEVTSCKPAHHLS